MVVLDEDSTTVCEQIGGRQEMVIESVRLRQPGMPYLYQLRAEIISEDGESVLNIYEMPLGVRSTKFKGNMFLINTKLF